MIAPGRTVNLHYPVFDFHKKNQGLIRNVHGVYEGQYIVDLREKALWGLVGAIIATMVILASLSFFIIMGNYLNLESTYVRSNVNLVTKNIDSEIKSLESNTLDWGAWDDTYDFVQGTNPDYVQANLVNATFKTLRANFIVITDRNGTIRYGQGYDLVSDKPEPLRPDIITELGNGQILERTISRMDRIQDPQPSRRPGYPQCIPGHSQ